MKLLSYLNESTVKNVKSIPQMKMECSEYIKLLSQYPEPNNAWRDAKLYRGTSLNIETIRKVTPRSDRKPRDTKQYVHDQFDIRFSKKFGWKPRSEGVMVTSDIHMAADYANESGGGPPCIFFSTNNFKYVYSPEICDFFIMVRNLWPFEGKDTEEGRSDRGILEMFKTDMIGLLGAIGKKEYRIKIKNLNNTDTISSIVADAIIKTYTDTNIREAVDRRVEIMFKCSNYYLVSQFFVDKLDLNL